MADGPDDANLLYVLDANVLIDASRDYYPISRVPEFWEWLLHRATQQRVAVPLEIYEELTDGSDVFGSGLSFGLVPGLDGLRPQSDGLNRGRRAAVVRPDQYGRVIELDALSLAEVLEVLNLEVVKESHREPSRASGGAGLIVLAP